VISIATAVTTRYEVNSRVTSLGEACSSPEIAGRIGSLCEQVLGRPDLVDDPRFATNELRVRHRTELEPMIETKLAELGAGNATERLLAAGIPTAAVNDLKGLVQHPQHEARTRWTFTGSPGGPVQVLRSPFNLEGIAEALGAVPGLGEHTDEVLAEFRDNLRAVDQLTRD
jgi:crotonobetainyl-CoA:carnitine CoA-transferase CaiB-like acyl-CoA transferase